MKKASSAELEMQSNTLQHASGIEKLTPSSQKAILSLWVRSHKEHRAEGSAVADTQPMVTHGSDPYAVWKLRC